MACIKKITDDLAFDCNNPGLIAGIVGVEEAIIINFEDVSSVSATPSTGSALITLKAGTKGYTIQCVKNSVQITEAARANDNAPTMLELTANIKLLSALPVVTYINGLLSGSFLLAVKTKTNQYYLLGAHSPLEVSDMVTDSATDGVTTATLKTPDGACGDYRYSITTELYNKLKTKA
jgi:hypothetical protein